MPINVWKYESELCWFFSEGQSAFERSTFGEMLARAEQYSTNSDGVRIETPVGLSDRVWAYVQRATDPGPARALDQCDADDIRELIDWEAADPRITARPKPAKSEEPSITPDDSKLVRYARVSRALNAITPRARRVLDLYFGLRGDYWALRNLGRIMAIMHETHAGRRLLDADPNGGERRSDERISDAWARFRASGNVNLGAMLSAAEKQACKVLSNAKHSYETARG